MKKLKINLGKGVILEAPIKLEMTIEEWIRMSEFINSNLGLKNYYKKN
jgi:hypothetical protein